MFNDPKAKSHAGYMPSTPLQGGGGEIYVYTAFLLSVILYFVHHATYLHQ
jgi:hypothetical protein